MTGLEHVRHQITGDAPGSTTEISYFRIGSDANLPKIYLQAALHADEQPGIMILHHLLPMLLEACQSGQLRARFVLFPMVNPLGMQDIRFGVHQGRHDAAAGLNHNRHWPDLFAQISAEVENRFGGSASTNRLQVQNAVLDWLDNQHPVTALDQQRQLIMQEAFDADMVLDLHCDEDALNHIFISPDLMPEYQDLADWVGSKATLTAEDSGGGSFDEVWTLLWRQLAQAHPDAQWPPLPLSATLEYRGNYHTFDDLNRADASNLFGFFCDRGLIDSEAPSRPEPAPTALPLNAMELLRSPASGLLAYHCTPGTAVRKGDLVAELIALDGEQAFRQRTPLYAGTDGVLFSRRLNKYVWPGCTVAKIAGREALASRGSYLLGD